MLDAAEERGIMQPAIPATATETDGKHCAGGVASGGGGNGILLWIAILGRENIILAIIVS